MDHRTRGFVIALACLAVGGLLPAAVSAQMAGEYIMALGLGTVVLLNGAIAFVHINEAGDAERVRTPKAMPAEIKTTALRTVTATPAS